MKVVWTPLARRRLAEIEAYIATDRPKAAREVAARSGGCLSVCERLTSRTGRRLTQYPNDDIRELLDRPFRLIFRVKAGTIEIITLMQRMSSVLGLNARPHSATVRPLSWPPK